MCEYAILFLLVRRARQSVPDNRGLLRSYAMSDEYHQTFVPGRAGLWLTLNRLNGHRLAFTAALLIKNRRCRDSCSRAFKVGD